LYFFFYLSIQFPYPNLPPPPRQAGFVGSGQSS
jgi:hypothetical protein